MNFYKHHLGDYAAGTSHLSWDEDCAYRRLIDQYYKREAPIPVDLKEAFRLARASSPSQRRAVDAVLREFFVLKADGWHQKRCDGEIVAANAQAETNRRISEDREAKRRERKVHDSLHESLHASLDGSCTNRPPVSMVEREPPQTPDSRLQTKDRGEGTARKRAARKRADPPPDRPDDVPEQTWADWTRLRKEKRAAVTETLLAEARTEAEKAGLTLERFLAAWCLRGSQGFSADWLKPNERGHVNGGNGGYAAQRNRAFAGEFADDAHLTIDEEKTHDIALPRARR